MFGPPVSGSRLQIRIRIRIVNLDTDPDCKSVYRTGSDCKSGSGLRIRIRIANPDTEPDCESGHASRLRIRTREGERHCTSMTISYTESILCVKGYHVSYNIVRERISIWSSVLSTVFNIVTTSLKICLLLLFYNIRYCSWKIIDKNGKKKLILLVKCQEKCA